MLARSTPCTSSATVTRGDRDLNLSEGLPYRREQLLDERYLWSPSGVQTRHHARMLLAPVDPTITIATRAPSIPWKDGMDGDHVWPQALDRIFRTRGRPRQ